MSWFYPLQKLFGYEVGPEDKTFDEQLLQMQNEEKEALKEKTFYTPARERVRESFRERKIRNLEKQLPPNRKSLTMRDADIYVSREREPAVREWQKKALRDDRFKDAMFRTGVGPYGTSVISNPKVDPYIPPIAGIQKQEGIEVDKTQAAVVAVMDTWNLNNKMTKYPNQFLGERTPNPFAKTLGEEVAFSIYNWDNFPDQTVTLLEQMDKQRGKSLEENAPTDTYAKAAYQISRDSMEWRKPITKEDKLTIAHEQVHRFIEKHPAGKGFRSRDREGDNELFVRTYTHLLGGGSIDDPELMKDLQYAASIYTDVDLNRFIKDVPRKIQAFERAILGAEDGESNKNRYRDIPSINVTATRPKPIDDQMEYLLSPIKQNEYFPTFIENLKLRESDHGSTPIPTNDDKEKHLPKNQKTLDIAYGHKIRPHELAAGEIHGIKFRDSTGNYIPLTDKNKIFILEQDIYRETNEALQASWNKKLADRGLVWEGLPNKYKYPLMDLAFNTGAETAKQWTVIFDDVKNNNDKSFVKNLRREGGTGTWTKGMDNRVAKVAYANGLVDSLKQAKEYGLKLADTNEIPRRVKSKKSKFIPYPIGVDTPTFKTQEEAAVYMDELPKSLRSNIKGTIQGVVRLSGLADIATYGKLMTPPKFGGIGIGPKFYENQTTWLNEADKFTTKVGKALVPRETDDSSVWITEQAIGLGMLGVASKQGIDLIRQYGPQAISKLKSYFNKNPKTTVNDAVKGILNKETTRRDVMKGVGAGAIAAGTVGKIGTSLLGKGITPLIHPKHMILNDNLSGLKFYPPPSKRIVEPIFHRESTNYPWLFKDSEGGYSNDAYRTIHKHFKKYDLDLKDDVASLNNMSDEIGWGKEIYTPQGIRKEAMKKGSHKDFSDFDRADEIYFNREGSRDPMFIMSQTSHHTVLNKKLDALKKKKDSAFKGEENGVELFEIDGSPVIRKTDYSGLDDMGNASEETMDFIDSGAAKIEQYWDKIILMPNNKGITKLN